METINTEKMQLIEAGTLESDREYIMSLARTSEEPSGESNLCCRVCYNFYHCPDEDGEIELPYTTPCGHTFGRTCYQEIIHRAKMLQTSSRCPYCATVLFQWTRWINLSVGVEIWNCISPGDNTPTLWFRCYVVDREDRHRNYDEVIPDFHVDISTLPLDEEFHIHVASRYKVDRTLEKQHEIVESFEDFQCACGRPQSDFGAYQRFSAKNLTLSDGKHETFQQVPADSIITSRHSTTRICFVAGPWPTMEARLRYVLSLSHIPTERSWDLMMFANLVDRREAPRRQTVQPLDVAIPVPVPVHTLAQLFQGFMKQTAGIIAHTQGWVAVIAARAAGIAVCAAQVARVIHDGVWNELWDEVWDETGEYRWLEMNGRRIG
ncbi:hypothetical protein BJ878DRAFT_129013 [Calycina marina]|uniref:RING-type domain-containing protein n=1 Tax=Calycina marina TaxID=1763456 RepID=A0A9P8CID1_9HELO|nr:hypothetical protein BJ878DRAFT_129013 [Calycina marina]